MTEPDLPVGPSVQERYAPASQCFGCGPANPQGLRLRSFPAASAGGDAGATNELVAIYRPAPHHQAYAGMLNGGIIGALLDCHSNWTAALALMQRDAGGSDGSGSRANAGGSAGDADAPAPTPPCTVTADFHVKLKHPTPVDAALELRAHPVEIAGDRVVIEATLSAGGQVTATCRGTFVAVQEGHPAYHRW